MLVNLLSKCEKSELMWIKYERERINMRHCESIVKVSDCNSSDKE